MTRQDMDKVAPWYFQAMNTCAVIMCSLAAICAALNGSAETMIFWWVLAWIAGKPKQ